jgi:hypothetical protein
MTGRRPIAGLFTALLVWLTAISSFRGALPSQTRLLDADGSGIATLSIAIPSAAASVLRPSPRPATPPPLDVAFLPAIQTEALVAPRSRRTTVPLASVRLAHGTARTYDATAPPRQTR